ncbi:Vps62-related protein [Actinospica durhamensis]|uniref:Vps62-related protein n=1 Tax=Actinospica durhamensis TaxID=1508375 RepID=A0A941IUW1_9ACTN|nr:Vps62-related protein [Actinospica durhamensis]MBR7839712.1 Vps62-related protein [Actinospica durhamensis]
MLDPTTENTLPYGRVVKKLPDKVMLDTLKKFSPLVWLHKRESYKPSSVDFAFQHMERFESKRYLYPRQPNMARPAYCVKAKEWWFSRVWYPSYFYGQDYDTSGGQRTCIATCYAFFVDKMGPFTDLTYFFFYPFNFVYEGRGLYGNHVSDWEYVTVRVCWTVGGPSGWENPQPWSVYASSHDGEGEVREWGSVTKSDGHPVIYSAVGTHANYYEPINHIRKRVLTDFCNQGTRWNTWDHLASFHWHPDNPDPSEPGTYAFTSLDGAAVPMWMKSNKYWEPGTGSGAPEDPDSGPVFRWGNEGDLLLQGTLDPPQGPLEKWEVWQPSKMG